MTAGQVVLRLLELADEFERKRQRASEWLAVKLVAFSRWLDSTEPRRRAELHNPAWYLD